MSIFSNIPLFNKQKATQQQAHQPKIDCLLNLADTSLIMGHRLSEYTGHGPSIELDIALTNISLDLIGQARNFYQYASVLLQEGASEDTLAYLRDAHDYKNLLLAELPNGDWGNTILKVFFLSNWQDLFYKKLLDCKDQQIAAIAEKSLKEVKYHLNWSSGWVIRLGDGTEESKARMINALQWLWPYTGEFFEPANYEKEFWADEEHISIDSVHPSWQQKVENVMNEAALPLPPTAKNMNTGGKDGLHTEHLGYILAEMQFLQRAYPGLEW